MARYCTTLIETMSSSARAPASPATRFHPGDRRRPRARGQSLGGRDAVPARAERIPSSVTPRRSRSTSGSPRSSAAASMRFDDTNPIKEEQEYIDSIQEDHPLPRLRLGRASLLRLRLLPSALRLGRTPDQGRLRRRPLRRQDREHRAPSPSRAGTAPGATVRSTTTSTCSSACAPASFRTAPVLRAKIDMASPNINMRDPVLYRIPRATRGPVTSGASIRCTTSPMASRTQSSRASPTPSARSSSRITDRSTTG